MRISRLAREHDLSVQELITYLETVEPPLKSVHPNAKLDEETIYLVVEHFDLTIEEETPEIIEEEISPEEEVEESVSIDEHEPAEEPKPEEKVNLPQTPEEEIALLEGELETNHTIAPEPTASVPPEEVNESQPTVSEEEVILSDQLIEMIESEDQSEGLDKIKLIKAPKKKLSGLKVLDKIEIPEDPKKKLKEQEEEEKVSRPQLSPEEKAERVKKREEYKEKRRVETKRKQEEYEVRKEKRRREQEANRLRAERESHYKQQLSKQKTQATNKKTKKPQTAAASATITTEPHRVEKEAPKKPKTILGKFWRWLNT